MKCPSCGSSEMELIAGGSARCRKCGHRSSAIPAAIEPDSFSNAETAGIDGPAPAARDSAPHVLVAENGPLKDQQFRIDGDGLSVGRHPALNQLVLDDSEISRQHASLHLDAQRRVTIESLSPNGTFVNGARVEQAVLQPGDKIRFGQNTQSIFVYRTGAPGKEISPSPPPPASQQSDVITPHGTKLVDVVPEEQKRTLVYKQDEEAPLPGARLQLILDQYAVRDIPLTSARVQLGSEAAPGRIQFEHPSISALHAEILFTRGGNAVLHDRGSTNGTFVNGQRITEHVLREGDLIQLGACDTRLLLYREARRRTIALKPVDLKPPVVKLGRAEGNQVRLNHPTVSQFHAEIHHRGQTYELIDRNSTNGTFVNGQRITRHKLEPRDRISLGAIQLVFDGARIEQQSDGSDVRLCAYGLVYALQNPLRVLINRVSLAIEPREFVGLLGPSGAGKTTLMHALNGSHPAGEGRVLLNGWNLYEDYAALRSLMGYLPQEDILHRALTPRQCLEYAAKLRLPDDFGPAEIRQRVAEVLEMLELQPRADVPILKLSGGQRKRVSLGIELLNKPSLLFMDEPTSGQDPRTEMHMMQLFRHIANRGATIVCTTHLLGSFSLLDKIAVLAEGRLAYFGPSLEMLPYFRASRPHEIYDRLQEKPAESWAKEFQRSQIFRECVANPLGEDKQAAAKRRPAASRTAPAPAKSGWRQFTTLLDRQLTLRFSDWAAIAGLLLPPLVIAGLVSAMCQVPNEPKVLFMTMFTALWFGCSAAVREIVDEDAIYRRERQRSLSIGGYLGSKIVYLTGIAAAQSLLFIFVLTISGGQENHFFAAWGLMWFMTVQGALIGLVVSGFAASPEAALYIFPLVLIPQLLLAGIFIPVDTPKDSFFLRNEGNGLRLEQPQVVPEGMDPVLHYVVSPAMVGRWGLEAMADLYVHDFELLPQCMSANAAGASKNSECDQLNYSLALLNSITLTFHDADLSAARLKLEETLRRRSASLGPEVPVLGSATALPEYLSVLFGFAAVMIGAAALALKRKDRN